MALPGPFSMKDSMPTRRSSVAKSAANCCRSISSPVSRSTSRPRSMVSFAARSARAAPPENWRAQATAWTAVYSMQFEFGPLSEASIGNVGLRGETTGWVDHVVTPVGAFGLMVGEDALDRYFVRWVEGRTQTRFFRAALRMTFNPARTLSNATTGHLPWYREGRPISWQ